jgi:uncharacterized protein YbaR (Trm112 family)
MKKMKKKLPNLKIFNRLVCPISREPLKFNEEKNELISEAAAVAFPIKNGIPILLIKEARELN